MTVLPERKAGPLLTASHMGDFDLPVCKMAEKYLPRWGVTRINPLQAVRGWDAVVGGGA